jgi:lysyl-tRNA synthetase, class II
MAPIIIGRLAYLFGILDILSNSIRPFKAPTRKLDQYTPLLINSTAFATSLFTGIALIIFARSLIRRKRRARNIAITILSINLISDFLRFHRHWTQLVFSGFLIIALIIWRKEFYAISDPTTRFTPFIAFGVILFISFCSGLLLIYYRHGADLEAGTNFRAVFATVAEGLVGITGPAKFSNDRIGDAVNISLQTLGLLTIVIPLLLYFRRVSPQPKETEEDAELIRQLIKHDTDQDSLGYFATRSDKSVIWTENRKAGIAYRVQNGVMLASGDPFGEFSLWPEVINNFLEEARRHAWTPAVMGASDFGGEVWVEHAGMLAIDIGDEAIIVVKDFTLEGRPMANVRQMVNRIKRKGYSTWSKRWKELTFEEQKELKVLAKKWRYGVAERGFSMSMDRFGGVEDGECLVSVAVLEGKIKGFLYFVPWCEDRISLDRMMREKNIDPGVTELLISETVEYAKEKNITHISLNFAAFRSLFERAEKISAGPIVRSTRNFIRFLSNWFQVESLYRFNAKFQPEWRTRYVLYPKPRDLATVGWAALRAEKFIAGFGRPDKKSVS